MISFILFFPILFVLGILWFEIKKKIGEDGRKVNQIPGPKTVPILGNVELVFVDPAKLFKKMREWSTKYYPVFRLWSSSAFYAVQLCAPEDMQLVLSNPIHNRKSLVYDSLHEWLGEGILTSHSEKWQQRRKILTPTFHFNILKRFIGVFNRHAAECVADFKNDTAQQIGILQHISKTSLFTITETAMGINLTNGSSEKRYRSSVQRMGGIILKRMIRPWMNFRIVQYFTYQFYEERFLLKYLKSFTKNVISEREKLFQEDDIASQCDQDHAEVCTDRKQKQLAMLDLLFSAKTRGEITDKGILEEVDTFMFEGHDTVSMSLQYTLLLLANHEDVQRKLFKEIMTVLGDRDPTYEDLNALTYMEMVIKESLRLYPSVPFISRISGEEFITSSGYTIPAGSILILNIFGTHRLEYIYPQAEKFIPERFNSENSKNRHPYAYLAFSAGSRNCIGKKYAMLNMKCKLAAIVRNFVLRPVDKLEDITLIADIVLRTKNKIRIEFLQRNKVNEN